MPSRAAIMSVFVLFPGRRQLEPVEPVHGQGEEVVELADRREQDTTHAFNRRDPSFIRLVRTGLVLLIPVVAAWRSSISDASTPWFGVAWAAPGLITCAKGRYLTGG